MAKYLLLLFCSIHCVYAQTLTLPRGQRALSTDSAFKILPMTVQHVENDAVEMPVTSDSNYSSFGYAHTPKGNLHMLFIYVGYTDATAADDIQYDNISWKHNTPPDYALSRPSKLIDDDPSHPSNHPNLTTWFKTMSAGNFSITGELFWVTINRPANRKPSQYNFNQLYKEAFKALQQQYPNEDWSRFDQRENFPNWKFDNSRFNHDSTKASGDGVIDYVVMNFRNIDNGPIWTGGADAHIFSGISITTNFKGGKTYQLGAGHAAHYVGPDHEHHHAYFIHEFAHVLFNAPHYFGANNLCGRHFYTNMGWGIMGAEHRPINTTNAWEKWWLGWNTPQLIIQNGTYTLQDFITANDAIRIRIPGTDQYLWLENHQQKNILDDKVFYREASPMGKGMYAFISAMGNDNRHPELFYPSNNSNTNNFKILSAKGNWDYSWKDTIPYRRFDKVRENPIAGQTDLTLIRENFDSHDQVISVNAYWNSETGGRNEQDGALNNGGIIDYAWSGSAADAFGVGDEIGLSGIIPPLNYPYYHERILHLDTFLLNGLSIQIMEYNHTTGAYTLSIKFDDVELRKDKRWCGDLELKNSSHDAKPDLVIKPGITLLLDKSGTPNTHTKGKDNREFPDFVRPTSFCMSDESYLLLDEKSRMIITDSSILTIAGQAKVEIKSNAILNIKSNSRLCLYAKSKLILAEKAKILFEDEGISVYRLNGKITVKNGKDLQIFDTDLLTVLKKLNIKNLVIN